MNALTPITATYGISWPSSFAIIVAVIVILSLIVVASLVSRRLSAQRSTLDDERKMLRALIDNIPDFMCVKDRNSRFVVANAHAVRVLGAGSIDAVLGKTDFDFLPPDLALAFYTDEQSVMQSGQPWYNREEKGIDGRGNETYVLTTKVPVRDKQGHIIGIASVGRDIGERKKSEEALWTAHHQAEVFINAVPSILIGMDHNSQITRWNSTATGTFGLTETEVFGKKLGDCIKWLRPDMTEEIRSWCGEQGSRRCDLVPVEINGEKRLLGLTITAVRMGDRNTTELLVIGSDVTDRSVLEAQLRQAQKLESVGQLAAGIAHEINTPTQYIGDNVRFLKDAFVELKGLLAIYERMTGAGAGQVTQDAAKEIATAAELADSAYLLEEIPKAIDQTLEGVTRVSKLVGAMKEFSHPGSKEKTPVDLNHAIENTIAVARNEWKYVADIDTDLDSTLPQISCLPDEFNQVILNLIVNAAHAIAEVVGKSGTEKGRIHVSTRNDAEWVEIRIRDTGAGIPERIRSRVFDPFFTTKEVGKGTGQGLAIARSVVVDKHGGTIHFETEAGKGTTFIIRLPQNSNAAAKAATA
jgi:PAS domain S-box-containing protein